MPVPTLVSVVCTVGAAAAVTSALEVLDDPPVQPAEARAMASPKMSPALLKAEARTVLTPFLPARKPFALERDQESRYLFFTHSRFLMTSLATDSNVSAHSAQHDSALGLVLETKAFLGHPTGCFQPS